MFFWKIWSLADRVYPYFSDCSVYDALAANICCPMVRHAHASVSPDLMRLQAIVSVLVMGGGHRTVYVLILGIFFSKILVCPSIMATYWGLYEYAEKRISANEEKKAARRNQ